MSKSVPARADSMRRSNEELARVGQIHQLVRAHGRDVARDMVTSDEKALVDRVHAFLADEESSIGITYSGFCILSFPHRKLKSDDEVWVRSTGPFSLLIEPGAVAKGRKVVRLGVPYGSRARLIMLYLQTQALRTRSPEVEIGSSMHDWLDRMGVPIGGTSYKDVREQAARISRCKLSFQWSGENEDGVKWSGFENDSIVKGGMSFQIDHDKDPRQPRLWEDTVRLSESFYKALEAHPVPVWEPALRQISNQSAAIDVYIWLAYRLRVIDKPKTISWADLWQQFGPNYSRLRAFRENFLTTLKDVLAVYPEAKVEATEQGLKLFRSPPAVPERKVVPVLLPGASAR
ncbi:replication protein RepA [Azospirillum sp. TSO5]|uniref:replication protein RepA n=1 Tax=Azospirillum sp. TSO5 TaxID=716760 RepID=UPI001FFEED64|nr:replication protein RepA [Azospirillum sp. TSO5]